MTTPYPSKIFIVLSSGARRIGDVELSEEALRERYSEMIDLGIKPALGEALAEMSIVRSDELAGPGQMQSETTLQLMHADLVIVEFTFPDPLVFYQLGLRHACKPATILLRDTSWGMPPYDLDQFTYLNYVHSPEGLERMAQEISGYLQDWPLRCKHPDNNLLRLATLTGYAPKTPKTLAQPNDGNDNSKHDTLANTALLNMMTELLQSPDVLQIMDDPELEEGQKQRKLLETMTADSQFMASLLDSFMHGFATPGGER